MSQLRHVKIPGTEVVLATLILGIPNDNSKHKTEFVTEPDHSIQVGLLHRPADSVVEAHQHLPVQKTVSGCQEVLYIKSGNVHVDVYDPEKNFVETVQIGAGDTYIQFYGGHRFRFLTDTQFIEIKQGPFTPADKVFFDPRCHEQMK